MSIHWSTYFFVKSDLSLASFKMRIKPWCFHEGCYQSPPRLRYCALIAVAHITKIKISHTCLPNQSQLHRRDPYRWLNRPCGDPRLSPNPHTTESDRAGRHYRFQTIIQTNCPATCQSADDAAKTPESTQKEKGLNYGAPLDKNSRPAVCVSPSLPLRLGHCGSITPHTPESGA